MIITQPCLKLYPWWFFPLPRPYFGLVVITWLLWQRFFYSSISDPSLSEVSSPDLRFLFGWFGTLIPQSRGHSCFLMHGHTPFPDVFVGNISPVVLVSLWFCSDFLVCNTSPEIQGEICTAIIFWLNQNVVSVKEIAAEREWNCLTVMHNYCIQIRSLIHVMRINARYGRWLSSPGELFKISYWFILLPRLSNSRLRSLCRTRHNKSRPNPRVNVLAFLTNWRIIQPLKLVDPISQLPWLVVLLSSFSEVWSSPSPGVCYQISCCDYFGVGSYFRWNQIGQIVAVSSCSSIFRRVMINTKAMLSLNSSTGTNRAHFNWFDEAPRVRKNLHYYLVSNPELGKRWYACDELNPYGGCSFPAISCEYNHICSACAYSSTAFLATLN